MTMLNTYKKPRLEPAVTLLPSWLMTTWFSESDKWNTFLHSVLNKIMEQCRIGKNRMSFYYASSGTLICVYLYFDVALLSNLCLRVITYLHKKWLVTVECRKQRPFWCHVWQCTKVEETDDLIEILKRSASTMFLSKQTHKVLVQAQNFPFNVCRKSLILRFLSGTRVWIGPEW